jgi:polysaccharide biosynthesis transport protein
MVSGDESAELELRDYLGVLRRRSMVIVATVAIVVGVAVLASFAQTERYRASTEVLVRQPTTAVSLEGAATATGTARSLANEVRQAEATAVLDAVRGAFGPDPQLGVRADADADVLRFTAESRDPTVAAQAADRYAEEFVQQRRAALVSDYLASSEVLQARVDELDAEAESVMSERAAAEAAVPLDAPDRDLALARIAAEVDRRTAGIAAQQQRYHELLNSLLLSAQLAQGSGAQVIRPAEVPSHPFEPMIARNAALALVVGLVLGVGAAFLLEYLDTSLRTDDDLATASGGLPVLATVPELSSWKANDAPHLATIEDPSSAQSESYRALRTAVQFLGLDRTIKTIALTSPGPGEGKSTTAANLAIICARAGQRVVLVDCDLRKPRVHEFFRLDNQRGFTTVLLGESTLESAAYRVPGVDALVVVPSGPIPPDPSELLAGYKAKSLITALAAQADLVIVDAPPVLVVSDPLVLSALVDGMILVTSARCTSRPDVERAVEHLQLVDAPMLGTVLNQVDPSMTGYGYGYGYGEAPSPRRSTRRRRRRSERGPTIPTIDLGDNLDDPTPTNWGNLPQVTSRSRL